MAERALMTREDFVEDGEAGVSLEQLAVALTTYVAMRGERITVRAAAEAFNTTDHVIVEAISGAALASIVGPIHNPLLSTIELDGEA